MLVVTDVKNRGENVRVLATIAESPVQAAVFVGKFRETDPPLGITRSSPLATAPITDCRSSVVRACSIRMVPRCMSVIEPTGRSLCSATASRL